MALAWCECKGASNYYLDVLIVFANNKHLKLVTFTYSYIYINALMQITLSFHSYAVVAVVVSPMRVHGCLSLQILYLLTKHHIYLSQLC